MKSKINSEFDSLIDQISKNTGLSDKDISLKMGRNSGFISQLKSRIKNNNEEVSKKFLDALKLHFANYNEVSEPEIPLLKENRNAPGGNRAMETLYSLAESNKVLVETNAELAGMLKSVFYKATGGYRQDIPTDVYSKLDNLLEVLAEVGSGKKWRSKEEALATLGKRFYVDSANG